MKTDHLDRRLRHAVHLQATVTTSDGASRSTSVTDLSLEGCCVSGFYLIGDHVELQIDPIGEFKAQVRWSFGGKAGLRFARQAVADDTD